MSGFLLANDVITTVAFLVPAVFVTGFWLWFRSNMNQANMMNMFLNVFTVCAAIIVLLGAISPRYFDIAGENKAFLIVVSLTAVLHATSSVGAAISGAKWRSQVKSGSRPIDKVN